ncbi:MAG: glycosyltransferase [Rhizomicrobium sp.]
MARDVLIVSPNFPPKSTADLHRVRMSLPHYRSYGWNPTVLCIAPECCEGIDDPLLAKSLPDDADIVRVAAWDISLCRKFGFGMLEYRGLLPLHRAGSRLLATGDYELVFFSTTAFATLTLGPLWRRKFGCKIVYDIQDPWYLGSDSPYDRSNVPGSWWKYKLAQAIARRAEAFAMRGADRLITVSQTYAEQLIGRYRFLDRDAFDVIPFGAAERDRDLAWDLFPRPSRDGQQRRWVSVGAMGPEMIAVVAAFFGVLAEYRKRHPAMASSLRIDFIGTSYAPAARTTASIQSLADKFGLSDMVREAPQRIPYFAALGEYRDSDAILLFGTGTKAYMPSRLFNCIMAEKPILAMFHRDSAVTRVAPDFSNIFLAAFSSPRDAAFLEAVSQGLDWLEMAKVDAGQVRQALRPWSAEELSRRQCQVFDRACAA